MGTKEKITITNDQNRLTPEDIEQMIKDAEMFADEDKKLKECVEARNELESYAYSLKNQINDKEKLGAKITDEDKEKIEEAVNENLLAGREPRSRRRGLQSTKERARGNCSAHHCKALPTRWRPTSRCRAWRRRRRLRQRRIVDLGHNQFVLPPSHV